MAGTVEFMINGDKKDKSNSPSSMYGYFGGYSPYGNDRTETATGGFRVDADVEHNQLILLANDVEMADVDNLLQKLGEMPANEGPGMTRRIIDTASDEEAKALLERHPALVGRGGAEQAGNQAICREGDYSGRGSAFRTERHASGRPQIVAAQSGRAQR